MKTWHCLSNCSDLSVHSLKPMKPLGCWSRLMYLYTSPQVKFYWNIVFYFAFLFLFAVVLMIDFQSTPSAGELLLYIWLLSLVCEEIRQVRNCGSDPQMIQNNKQIAFFSFVCTVLYCRETVFEFFNTNSGPIHL